MMRLPASILVLLFGATLAAAAQEASPVEGKWKVHTSAAGRENDQICAFQQKGGELSGHCVTPHGKAELAGKVEGVDITWTYKTDSEGGPVTVVFKGKVDPAARKMAGSILAVEFSVEGEFIAIPSAN